MANIDSAAAPFDNDFRYDNSSEQASKKFQFYVPNFEPWIQRTYFWEKNILASTKSQFWKYVNESAFCNVI